jgi:hypothetical protein
MLRYIPSIPIFIRAFIMKRCWILSKAFFYWHDHVVFVFASVNILYCIYWFVYVEASLGWNWLDHSVRSFWYVVEFVLPVFLLRIFLQLFFEVINPICEDSICNDLIISWKPHILILLVWRLSSTWIFLLLLMGLEFEFRKCS